MEKKKEKAWTYKGRLGHVGLSQPMCKYLIRWLHVNLIIHAHVLSESHGSLSLSLSLSDHTNA